MPRVTGAEAIRKLERAGWVLIRVRGSHHLLQHPTLPGNVIVPVHANHIVPLGTLRKIIRDAGLTITQFTNL